MHASRGPRHAKPTGGGPWHAVFSHFSFDAISAIFYAFILDCPNCLFHATLSASAAAAHLEPFNGGLSHVQRGVGNDADRRHRNGSQLGMPWLSRLSRLPWMLRRLPWVQRLLGLLRVWRGLRRLLRVWWRLRRVLWLHRLLGWSWNRLGLWLRLLWPL